VCLIVSYPEKIVVIIIKSVINLESIADDCLSDKNASTVEGVLK